MNEKQRVSESAIHSILERYGLDTTFGEQREYIHYIDDTHVKVILSVLLENGKRVVIKILRETDDLPKEKAKIEKQSAFSEFMRLHGIQTPTRYMANGAFCGEYIYNRLPCIIAAEDWCGEEIKEINADISRGIGELMARMHTLSLESSYRIGCGTLFSAAYWNDVDAFQSFCEIGRDERLNQAVVEQIKRLHDEKLAALRAVWHRLPTAAVQGDISINNLVYGEDGLIVFDYNNAGDEALVSDLVMEGLLTAYEMDLPEGAEQGCREEFFPALLDGYLSVRKLSAEEADAAWLIYTLYHSLWFTRVIYNEDSLEKLVKTENYPAANRLLAQMLADMTERDDGRFRR